MPIDSGSMNKQFIRNSQYNGHANEKTQDLHQKISTNNENTDPIFTFNSQKVDRSRIESVKDAIVIPLFIISTMTGPTQSQLFKIVRDEFLVNASTEFRQDFVEVAMASNGQFVVAWVSRNSSEPDSFDRIFAQRFGASGESLGVDLPIDTTINSNKYLSGLGMDDDANFIAAWDGSGIHLRRFDSDAIAQSDEFTVGDSTLFNTSSDVAMAANGDFVVTWESHPENQFLISDIYAQQFNSNGVAKGDAFRVNTTTGVSQESPKVAIDADGDFVVTWESGDLDTGTDIYARRFDSAGAALGGEVRINDTLSTIISCVYVLYIYLLFWYFVVKKKKCNSIAFDE